MKINCHCHIFSSDCVPREFLDRFVLNIENPAHRFIHKFVKLFLPRNSNLEMWINLVGFSISQIAIGLAKEMDDAGIEVSTLLMMDMEFCPKFGDGMTSFEQQLVETIEAVEKVNQVYGRTRMLPFIAADPRRKDIVKIVLNALQSSLFKGVKIYPTMGFIPDDPTLYPIYEYCIATRTPVTAHCQNGGIPGLQGYHHLAHPERWRTVLSQFPDLTLNLAHNDCTGSPWQPVIADLIMEYPNVYTDVSYDTEMLYMPARYFRSVKKILNTPKIQDRLLYGTDWYMGRCFWTEESYLKWFTTYSRKIPWCRVEFTDEEIQRLTEKNPKSFLGMN